MGFSFKKVFVCIVMAVMIILMPSTVFAVIDVSDHWAKEQIKVWASKELVKGYSDNTFKPDKNITRAEFFALINKVFGYQEKAEINFPDVSRNAWYYDEIAKAAGAGYVAGYPDGTIKPQAYITRQEAAAAVAGAFGLGNNVPYPGTEFKDAGNIQNWAKNIVSSMKDKGVINGFPDGTFRPENNIKRAESIVILDNASGNILNKPGTYSEETKGNLVVNTGDVVLKDMTIAGDLYLGEGIGDGEVTLDGVTVKGKTLVRGGGENSVILRNTMLGDVEVNKPSGSGQPVRIVSEGNTNVSGTVTVNSAIKLEEINVSQGATGFNNVVVSDKLPETARVQFSGEFKEVNLTAKQGLIEISGNATVSSITVQAAAKVVIAEGAKVSNLTVAETAQGANIEAKAQVKVQVKAENVTVNNTTIATGSTADISSGGTTTVTPGTGSSDSSTGGSDNGGSGGSDNGGNDDSGGGDDSGGTETSSVTLSIPDDGLIPFHFDVIVKNPLTNTNVTGLAAGNFSLKKGQTDIPLNAEVFHEWVSEVPQDNVPGRYTIYPADEYRPMEGVYTLTFNMTGFHSSAVTFEVGAIPGEPDTIQGANVSITAGSAVFNYGFIGSDSSTITYDEALTAPYNLNLAGSTVRLEKRNGETVTHSTYNIPFDQLNITAGSVSYADLDAVENVFGHPDFMNVWQGPPTHMVLVLKGGLAEDVWELDPITVQFTQSDIAAFTGIMPSPGGGGGTPGPFTPGDGGSLPVFPAFNTEPGRIGELYISRSYRNNNFIGGGTRPVVDFAFKTPKTYGAAGYTLQHSADEGITWQNYRYDGADLTTSSDTQDNFSFTPDGSYKYRLLVSGGQYDGCVSNEAGAPLSNVDTTFSGWSLDEGMLLTGIMTPYAGSGKAASFTVTKLSDSSEVSGYLAYQWYRVNPVSFEMTPIPGATGLNYTTTADDAGYYLLCRAEGDGVNVGGFAQIISFNAPEIPNSTYVTNVTPSGFRVNLYKSVSGLAPGDLKLYYLNQSYQSVSITISSVTHVENNAVFDVSAAIPEGVTSVFLENTSPAWRIVSDIGQAHMMTSSVEIPLAD